MPWGVQGHAAAAGQFFVMLQPAIRRRHRDVGHAKHLALHFQVVPQKLIILMQVQRSTGLFLQLAGSQEMIKVSMGVDNAHHLQAQRIKARQNQLVIAAGVDDDGFFSDRVANDGAVALQRADGEGFSY